MQSKASELNRYYHISDSPVYEIIKTIQTNTAIQSGVFKARNCQDNNFYVLKMYSKTRNFGEVTCNVDMISHPSFIRLVESFPNANFPPDLIRPLRGKQELVIVFPYMRNGSIGNYCEGTKKFKDNHIFPSPPIIIWILGTAIGIEYMHRNNFCHRDIKPSNILLDGNLYPKISDFEFTKFIPQGSDAKLNSNLGTFLYKAPEIEKVNSGSGQSEYTSQCDVFSFGILLFVILLRYTPKNQEEVLLSLKNLFTNDYSKFNIPIHFAILIALCLNNEPKKRPTFKEIVKILLRPEFTLLNSNEERIFHYLSEIIPDYKTDADFKKLVDYRNSVFSNENGCFEEYEKISKDPFYDLSFYQNADFNQTFLDWEINPIKVKFEFVKSEIKMYFFKLALEKRQEPKALLKKGFENLKSFPDKASSYFKIAADNGSVEGMFNYATELMKRKQYNESIHYFTSLINVPYKIDSGLKVKALYRLGECYFQNKNYLDAETFYNQSIKCYIDQSTKTTKNIEYSHYSYFKLATIYLWEKKTEQVVTCINNCIESNNPQFLVDCVLLLNKVREKSTENLKSEILAKLNSSTTIKENSKAIQGLIQICEKKKMWKKSRKYCKIGIKLKLEEEEDKNYFKFHLAQSKMEEGKEIMAKLASKGYQNAALFLKS